MRVLIIGGKGFFGSHVTRVLADMAGCEAIVGGRRSDSAARIDLANVDTFKTMKEFDVVVNCTDSVETSPLPAIRYCLDNGCTFVDTIADPGAIENVLHAIRRFPGNEAGTFSGRVILGMGFMPGISNLLASQLLKKGSKPERLEIAVRSSSFAGGGRGMAVLMARCLLQNAVRYENGHRIEDPPVSRGITAPFFGADRKTARVGLPEGVMLPWSTGARSTATYVAPKPEFMRYVLHAMAAAVPNSERGRQMFFDAMMKSFTYQRSTVYREKPTSVEVTAVLDRQGKGQLIGKYLTMRVDKGIECGAFAIAAAVEQLSEKDVIPPGFHLPEEIFTLDPIVEAIRRLSKNGIVMELQPS